MDDITELKARRLADACNGLGLRAQFFYDRGPFACQVALRHSNEPVDEFEPSLLFMIDEGDRGKLINSSTGEQFGWMWNAQLTGLDGDYYDLGFEIPERTHLNETEHTVAYRVSLLVGMMDVSHLVPA